MPAPSGGMRPAWPKARSERSAHPRRSTRSKSRSVDGRNFSLAIGFDAMPDYEPAIILSACRTEPLRGRAPAIDLATVVVGETIGRSGLAPEHIGDVVLGCVWPDVEGGNLAREASRRAGVP